MNIAINGFGRIGRAVLKILLEKKNMNIVAINDLNPIATLVHLLKFDSVYGVFHENIKFNNSSLIIKGKRIKVTAKKNPLELPWKELKVDLVIESTGVFRTHAQSIKHIAAGARKVIISAPPKDCNCKDKNCQVKIIVPGVNEKILRKSDKVLSMASCTTNCLAPVTNVIKKAFGVKKAIMTTVHSYTAGQNLVDGANNDLRRARAAAVNIVPTTTGAAKATCITLPDLVGKFDGIAIRVPTPTVSLCDIVYVTSKKTTKEKINKAFIKASKSTGLKNILSVSSLPLVSSDYIGDSSSAIVDLALTNVIDGDLLKVLAWYDNEWGYSARLADTCEYIKIKKLI